MSMSTDVVGFRPPDRRWQEMKAVWDACSTANITIPPEVRNFFKQEPPDPRGVTVELPSNCLTEWSDDTSLGYEVDVRELPDDLVIIRFYNSW